MVRSRAYACARRVGAPEAARRYRCRTVSDVMSLSWHVAERQA